MFFSKKLKKSRREADKSKLAQESQNLPGFYRQFLKQSGQSTQLDTGLMVNAYHQRNRNRQSKKVQPNNIPDGMRLAGLDVFRTANLDSDRDLDDLDYFKTGIRGINHYRREPELAGNLGDAYFELRPEPRNAFDSNAIAIISNGHRIGYISATIAQLYQGVVLGFQQSGKRVFVPGRIDKPDSGIVVLPTIRKINQIVQTESSKPIN